MMEHEGRELNDLLSIISGATNSIAALTEQFQARLPFYVSGQVNQTFTTTTSGTVYTIALPPLATQLVRLTGIVAVVDGSTIAEVGATTLQIGNGFTCPLPVVAAGNARSSASLVVPICSIMLDTLSQGGSSLPSHVGGTGIVLNCTAAGTGNLTMGLWAWGEQQPATGMIGGG